MAWNPPPEPNYERDIERLIRYYRQAVREIVSALTTLDLNELDARHRAKILQQIERILFELDKNAKEWVEENIPKAYREGQAAALVSLGEAVTVSSAMESISFSRLNRDFVEAMVADTFDDLLQATQNTRRKVKQTVREVVSEQMRAKATENLGRKTMIRDVIKQLREKLGESAEFAIVDRANRTWTIENYAKVVVQTKIQQSHIEGMTNEAVGRGAYYGIVSSHGAKDACRWHEGRIVKLTVNAPGIYPTISELRASNQIFHPYCKHSVHALRDESLLPQPVREKAERQADLGDKALATGKRNPTDIE